LNILLIVRKTKYIDMHVFTAELPYEKDAVVTKFLVKNFYKVDDFIMSLGQMSNIPPSRLLSFEDGRFVSEKVFIKNNYKNRHQNMCPIVFILCICTIVSV